MCKRGDGFIGKNIRKMKFQQQQQQQQQQQHHVTIEKTTSRVSKKVSNFFDLKFSFVWVSFRCMRKDTFSIKDTRSTPKNPAHAHKKKNYLIKRHDTRTTLEYYISNYYERKVVFSINVFRRRALLFLLLLKDNTGGSERFRGRV